MTLAVPQGARPTRSNESAPDEAGDSLAHALRHLQADPRLGPWINTLPAPELDHGRTHFHALARSILFQQLSGKAAQTIYERLVARGRPHGRGSFPTPAALLDLDEGAFRECGVSRQKAAYLQDLAAHFASGRLQARRLARLDDKQVVAELTRVKGVGVWTAQMFLMFTLGRRDIFPLGDLGIRKGMERLFHLRKEPSERRLLQLAAPWRPFRSVACWYLWRLQD